MAIMEGTRALKVWQGDYSFAVDGGALSTITLRSNDGPLPSGSYVVGGLLDIVSAVTTSGTTTGALQVAGANDIINATTVGGAPWSTTGQKDIIPDATGSTAIELAAAASPAFVIGGSDAATGGVFKLVLFYR